ncbi:uncharacterized protein LOC130797226 isoform X2 [Amaranthus tricolor]|uniref:uncharacterized protein LOC130797226 isoform X2 n=1 Tax=Amaranthus tricolor TaxID=29722 RepID=UPI00258C4998|nr:uncharacterized protein LOC130797226 isoform X2 [Amaranthus tricolor]
MHDSNIEMQPELSKEGTILSRQSKPLKSETNITKGLKPTRTESRENSLPAYLARYLDIRILHQGSRKSKERHQCTWTKKPRPKRSPNSPHRNHRTSSKRRSILKNSMKAIYSMIGREVVVVMMMKTKRKKYRMSVRMMVLLLMAMKMRKNPKKMMMRKGIERSGKRKDLLVAIG